MAGTSGGMRSRVNGAANGGTKREANGRATGMATGMVTGGVNGGAGRREGAASGGVGSAELLARLGEASNPAHEKVPGPVVVDERSTFDLGDSIGPRRFLPSLIAGVSVLAMSTLAPGDLVSGWNFNDLDPATGVAESSEGKGWLDFGRLVDSTEAYEGTLVNAWGDWAAGDSMGLRGAGVEGGSLHAGAVLAPKMDGISRMVRMSVATRRSATGFDRIQVERWEAGVWRSLSMLVVDVDWTRHALDFELPSQTVDVLLRMTFTGASSGVGTVRLDNLVLETIPIPAPGVAGVASIGGIVCARRQRRR